MRFYPDSVDPFPNEPTKDRFEVVELGEGVGKGLVAKVRFGIGPIANFTGSITDKRDKYTVELTPEDHVDDPYFLKWITHSCDPTIVVDKDRMCLVAIKEIQPGDLIAFDYEDNETVLAEPFNCKCGAASCRKVIRGKGSKKEDETNIP